MTEGKIDNLEINIPKSFKSFDPHGTVEIYQRHLPHWRQEGASYFVTFRLADSIPKEILADLKEQQKSWSDALADARKNSPDNRIPASVREEYEAFHRRYWKVVENELDRCSGKCELRSPRNREIVSDVIRYFDGERYSIYSAVVMPNHCHILIRPFSDFTLEKILGSWKAFSARKINESTGKIGRPFWQDESFDRIVRDEAHFRKCVRYILKNPVKAKLKPNDFDLWTAKEIS